MSSRGAPGQRHSLLLNKRLDSIPVGRQLQRTPPTKPPNTQTTRPSGELDGQPEPDSQTVPQDNAPSRQDDSMCPSVKEERTLCRRSSLTPACAKRENADPDALIQGMQGYQWTDADLEFIYQAKQQKQAQQLQQELSEVEKALQAETQRLELALASRDRLKSELSKLDGLGDKALLSLLNLQDVQRALREENAEISRLEREVAKAQELRDEEEKAMKEMDICQNKICTLQASVDALKLELADLKTRLSEKEEASKAAQVQREVHKAAKVRAISDAPKPPEEKDAEEMKASQLSVVSQVPQKGRKGSRRDKPSTKALKEKAGKDTAMEGKMAPKEKASKKMTTREATKKGTSLEEMVPNDTTSVKMVPEKMLSNGAEVLRKGHKGSRRAKTSTTAPEDGALKKVALKDLPENKMVSGGTADKEIAVKGKIKASKKNAKKDLVPDETTSQVNAPEDLPPEVKASTVAQELEKGRKGSRIAKQSTKAPKDMAKTEMVDKKIDQIEVDKKGKTARKVKAPEKTSMNIAEKKMAPGEMASELKTLDDNVLEEIAPKVKAPRKRTLKKTADLGMPAELTLDGVTVSKKMASKVRAPMKTMSTKTAEKEMVPNETASQIKTLEGMGSKGRAHKTVTSEKSDMERTLKVKAPEGTSLEETAPKVKAPRKKTLKKIADMEMPAELTVDGPTVSKQRTSKVRALTKTTSTKTDLKESTMQEMAEDTLKEMVLKKGQKGASKKEMAVKNKVKKVASKQKAGNNPSEDEDSSDSAQGKAQKAAKAPKESDPETMRRSKRNAGKNPSSSKTIPE